MTDKDRDPWPTEWCEAEEERDDESERIDEYQSSAMRNWLEEEDHDR